MQGRDVSVALGLVLSLVACGSSEPPPSSTSAPVVSGAREDEPGSTRASREAAREAGDPGAAAIAPVTTPTPIARPVRPLFVLRAIAAQRGEDGRGGTIAATDPIAVDLDAREFPARALDPVLTIGALRFERYEHPEPGVMRFVIADRALLVEGAEASVQYGDDASTRLVVAPSVHLADVRAQEAP